MSTQNYFRRVKLLTATMLTISISLAIFASSAFAGGGAVAHEQLTIARLIDESPLLKSDPDGSGVKAAVVILFFRRDGMWDGGLAMHHKMLYPELFRTVLLPKDMANEAFYSEEVMKKWAREFDSVKAVQELLSTLSLEEGQERALNNVATSFIQGCDVELRELMSFRDGKVAGQRDDGKNARILEQMKEKSADFWGGYWVGVAQGLWTAAAVQVDQILSDEQKKKFDLQMDSWRRKHATLLKEQPETKR